MRLVPVGGEIVWPNSAVTDRASSARELNAMPIWQDLGSDPGSPHGYQTVALCSQGVRIGVATTRGDHPHRCSAAAAISSDAGRGAGGPSSQQNNEHRAENQPDSHDLNYGRPRENAGTAMQKRFFSSFEEQMGLPPKLDPTASMESRTWSVLLCDLELVSQWSTVRISWSAKY